MKRKTTPICGCGIKCRETQLNVFECPRCQKVIVRGKFQTISGKTHPGRVYPPIEAPKGPIKLMGHDTYLNIEQTTSGSITANLDEKELCECDVCHGTMEAKCGAVCPGCKWVRPCSTEL